MDNFCSKATSQFLLLTTGSASWLWGRVFGKLGQRCQYLLSSLLKVWCLLKFHLWKIVTHILVISSRSSCTAVESSWHGGLKVSGVMVSDIIFFNVTVFV